MDPIPLISLLIAGGVVLLVGELLLPTHGLLGVVGLLCFGAAVGAVFWIDRWMGLLAFVAAIIASPFAVKLCMTMWERSPVGRRIILRPVRDVRAPAAVSLGQIGTAVTELRPIGECDFGEQRLEAVCELGMIHPGQKVKVVALSVDGRPTVRAVNA